MSSLHTFLSIRKRVTQRATRYSLLVTLLMVGLFLEAYMHNFNLVYISLFFVFAAAFSAGYFGMRNLGYLDAAYTGSDRLFARNASLCHFSIINNGTSNGWGIDLHTPLATTPIPELRPHTKVAIKLAITPERRGVIDIGPCTLQSLFPLATVRFVVTLREHCEQLVYPQPGGEPLEQYLRRMRAPFGDEMDFDGIARYSGTESASRIHWPSVAKGDISIKTFAHEAEAQTLQFDFYTCADDDESRLSQLTLWCLECEAQKLAFSITMPRRTHHYPHESIDEILEHLARF